MKIKPSTLSLDHKVWEFDFWVTPSLSEIKSSKKYSNEMARILKALSIISSTEMPEQRRYSADLAERITQNLGTHNDTNDILNSVAALLFLVTGKSDNNHKCQFPIFLKNIIGWTKIPKVINRKKNYILVEDDIPRVLDSDSYMKRISSIYEASNNCERNSKEYREKFSLLLMEFIDSILSDSGSKDQLTAFIKAYLHSIESGSDPSLLLAPLVTFQVRGSVSASGGHEPEVILRKKMTEWGMRQDIDYNSSDVIVRTADGSDLQQEVENNLEVKAKTRAYDFVLPFKTPNWKPRIYIQSQFYAGDSGSVSHKNVDQTAASRRHVLGLYDQNKGLAPPLFVEYVDGAGYCASLNRDLRSLLNYSSTHDFFQIRSASIRLRRLFQHIGFLTPIDLLHALLRSNGNLTTAKQILSSEGYTSDEIIRSIITTEELGYIRASGNEFHISSEIIPIARQYLLLDCIANIGSPLPSLQDCYGCVLIPGFGPYYGVRLGDIQSKIPSDILGVIGNNLLQDLNALVDSGHAKFH